METLRRRSHLVRAEPAPTPQECLIVFEPGSSGTRIEGDVDVRAQPRVAPARRKRQARRTWATRSRRLSSASGQRWSGRMA